jgi:hypothetical protein
MIDGQIATLPLEPSDPWYSFVQAYKVLPVKPGPYGKTKSLKAHSTYLPGGVKISSTFSTTYEVGRMTIDLEDRKLIRDDLITALAGWGWVFLRLGNEAFVFRKAIGLVEGESTMPSAMTLILEKLGVEPNQDWGIGGL